MKPLGPIPPGFSAIDGELAIAGRKASDLVAEAGHTPLFVYDAGLMTARVAALRAALPERVGLHYAMKANPYAPVLRHMAGLMAGDASGEGSIVIHGRTVQRNGKIASNIRSVRSGIGFVFQQFNHFASLFVCNVFFDNLYNGFCKIFPVLCPLAAPCAQVVVVEQVATEV